MSYCPLISFQKQYCTEVTCMGEDCMLWSLNRDSCLIRLALLKYTSDVATNKETSVEDKIKNSIKSGERLYLKPAIMKSMDNYDDPMRIQSVKGAVVYNKIKFPDMAAINTDERTAVDILKVDINKNNIGPLQETYPDIYESVSQLLLMPAFKTGISAISLPPDVDIPEWLFDYIDFDTIVNDNLTPFPIETIGLSRMDKTAINYTNIIQL